MYSIFGIKTRPIDKVEATTNDISSSEGWTIGLTSARTTEAVSVISVISVTLFVPTWQSVHVHTLGRQTNTHVAITAFGNDFNLIIIKATGGWNEMCCTYG